MDRTGKASEEKQSTSLQPGLAESRIVMGHLGENLVSRKKQKPSVLVVDDNSTLRYVLARLASLAEYDIQEAASAEEALDCLGRETPQAVVADIRLPGMDGFELCRRIKTNKMCSKIPVILVTSMYYASANEEAEIRKGRKRAKEVGADELLPRGEALEKLGTLLTKIATRKKPVSTALRRAGSRAR